ncbi:hypothetical protein [Novosphingobium sp. Gsoil 351]|uniref:hypothetical protein n=1 Tax=Novosphingobium sp. Gsoil 351 TaxID=2675225 RepID=UPI0012B4E8B4|nr:hypothetical protein [Novosphingobium sp. Gsoil 351]QGN54134.1 hypothetical protein GKE62_05835 [Novosphingobium sp. Gsoil 351]
MIEGQAQARIYQALCAVGVGDALPPGALGAIYGELSHLRCAGGPPDRADIAERIPVKLLRLEWALRLRNKPGVERYRDDLRQLWWEWLNQPIHATLRAAEREDAIGPAS